MIYECSVKVNLHREKVKLLLLLLQLIIVIITIIIEKYKMLKDEITRMWGMKKVIVIPLVGGVLGAI